VAPGRKYRRARAASTRRPKKRPSEESQRVAGEDGGAKQTAKQCARRDTPVRKVSGGDERDVLGDRQADGGPHSSRIVVTSVRPDAYRRE